MNINLSTITPAAVMNFLSMVLATWQLSEIVAKHRGPFDIFARLRERQARAIQRSRRPNRVGLLSCPFCVAPWAGALTLMLWHFIPWLNWPLALAWTYTTSIIVLRRVLAPESQKPAGTAATTPPTREWQREVLIGQDANGRVEVRRNEFSEGELLRIFSTFAANLMTSVRESAEPSQAQPQSQPQHPSPSQSSAPAGGPSAV